MYFYVWFENEFLEYSLFYSFLFFKVSIIYISTEKKKKRIKDPFLLSSLFSHSTFCVVTNLAR